MIQTNRLTFILRYFTPPRYLNGTDFHPVWLRHRPSKCSSDNVTAIIRLDSTNPSNAHMLAVLTFVLFVYILVYCYYQCVM